MSKAPSMPMYWDAYLADTTHLTTEEHGAYLLLLAAMWRRNGWVPDEDGDNARILGLTIGKWRRIKARLSPLLVFRDGLISQGNLLKIWENTQEKIERNRENGSKGGRPKISKNNDMAKADGFVSHNPNESIPEPEPDIEANASIDTPPPTKPKRKRHVHEDTPEFCAFWDAYPRREAKGDARKAFAAASAKADPAIIIAAARRVEDRGQYTPHPATWLNGERWADQEQSHGQRGQNRTGSPLFDAAMRVAKRERASCGTGDGCAEDDPGEPRMAWGSGGGVVVSLLATGRAASYG